MDDPHASFTRGCLAAFALLTDRFGFGAAEIDPIGREIFVRYHKLNHTVSIAYEPGCSPIVELFYPSAETGEAPVPWAARNGIQRTRRIPRLLVAEDFSDSDAMSVERYLRATARALEQVEHEWLAA